MKVGYNILEIKQQNYFIAKGTFIGPLLQVTGLV